MPEISDFLTVLEGFAPSFLKMQGDNVGLLVGDPNREVRRVMLTLDITPAVAQAAVQAGVDLVISHHPVIFRPLASVTPADYNGAAVMTLLEGRTAAICMHTNLDAATGGVNDTLARVLGLRDVGLVDDGGQGILRRGTLSEELTPAAFAAYVGQRLGCRGVRWIEGSRPIRTVTVCGGAGGSHEDAMFALASGCDAYVTAEVKYPVSLELAYAGLTVVDAGHFHTENPVLDTLETLLAKNFPGIPLLRSAHDDPMKFQTF